MDSRYAFNRPENYIVQLLGDEAKVVADEWQLAVLLGLQPD